MKATCRECNWPVEVPDVSPSSGVWTHGDPFVCVKNLRAQRDTLLSEVNAWVKRAMQAEREYAQAQAEKERTP